MTKIRKLLREVRSMLPIQRRRRIHAYGVGAAKTGTTSLASIFDANFRAAHEPAREELVDMFEREEAGDVTREQIVRFLRRRDRKLGLEMDSSAMNRRYAGLTAELFPDARFILTVRDPYTRTDSLINHLLNNPPTGRVRERADVVFRADRYQHAPEERLLAEKGLHTLDGILAEYAETTFDVIRSVPKDQLLVVRTDKLRDDLAEVADFLGIPKESLDSARSHSYKAKRKYGVLLELDQDFVDQKVQHHCEKILARFFPDIRSISDVAHGLQGD